MQRILTYAERNTLVLPPNVITVPAATATLVFEDIRKTIDEVASRYIQNTGANGLYYSFGVTTALGGASCDALKNYHGYLAAGQQLDCTQHRQVVSVYSDAGTTVSTTTILRRDLTAHN